MFHSMMLLVHLFFGQCLIFWNEFRFTNGSPLIGQNVRAAQPTEFRGVVSIQKFYLTSNQSSPVEEHECTGTLISRNDVLTADHCFELANDLIGYRISVGTPNILTNRIYHPSWWLTYLVWANRYGARVRYYNNDLAIIRLTENVATEIRPASIHFIKNENLFNLTAEIAGWGKFRNGTNNPILQTGEVKILSKAACEQKLTALRGEASTIESIMLCTIAEPYVIFTKGDSGGPLFLDGRVVAVNKALGPGNADHIPRETKLNVHIGLRYYKKYIEHVQFDC